MSKRPRNESAQLALLCAQNALSMGAQTQLRLCPAPRRPSLRAALRRRATERQQELQNMSIVVSPQQVGLESFLGREQLEDYLAQEEEFLLKDDTEDSDDEKFSSADEDDLRDVAAMFSEESTDLNHDAEYLNLTEQLYAPFVLEQGEPAQEPKLPFNWRKIQFFDGVSSDDRAKARGYLKSELRKLKKRSAQAYSRTLEVAARRRAGELVQEDMEEVFTVSHFPYSMNPCLASALIAESLALNPHESIEGMAACYEGIVSAGVAVLDAPDPTQPTRTRNSRSEIMAALAPLLVTTLEQPSGEVILSLAKLRRRCATDRYARRFVQRIGPALIRPPGAAMWCLRHQNDMEAILAATELLFDAAFEVFTKGWYDRGRWMLADSKRAETLSAAAQQLRSLSHEPGLAFTNVRRTRKKDEEPLAEWEVIAVDRQIRASISNMLQSDWTKTAPTPVPRPLRIRSTSNASSVRSRTPRMNSSPRLDTRTDVGERSNSPPPPPSPKRPSEKDSPTQTHTAVAPPARSPRSPSRHTVDLSLQNRITPISPSSVGTSTSMADMITYRPTPPGPREYRMLTSTAAERKRTVAACRALRAQISRFEEAFIRLHGRPPKGAADRAPLATTYAQYREWKRAIRADAACRIQALFRGALCRWMLLRNGNAQMVKVIRSRAGQKHNLPPSIPADNDDARSLASPSPWSQDPFPEQSSQQSAQEDISQLPAAELQMRKRDLKQQLKQYDIEFVQRHGRMPLKAEKEPIRHLYESYNRLKGQISQMTREKGSRRAPNNAASIASTTGAPQRSVSPSSGSESEDSPARQGPFSSRQQRNHRHHLPTSPAPVATASPTAAPSTGTPSNAGGDLAALRAEKQNLHAMLRSYERDFFRENRRQVSSFADIRPVASQYRRYKEIKRAMAAIQQGGGGHQPDESINVRR